MKRDRGKIVFVVLLLITATVLTATVVKLSGKALPFLNLVGVGFIIGFFFSLPSLVWLFTR